jgi:hypothetical protein
MGSAGLIIDLDFDNAKAVEAVQYVRDKYGEAFVDIAKKGKQGMGDVETGILNAHRSAHLLLEEFGIHLPRAVVDAIAKMLPEIASFGGALLVAFAIQEIPHLITGIKNAADEWDGFGKAEQAAMKKAIDDTKTLHEKVISVEHELELFGKSEADQAAMHARWASEDAQKALDASLKADKALAELNEKVKEAKRGAGVFAEGAGGEYAKEIAAATAAVNKAREAWKLADDNALLAQRRAREANAAQVKKDEKTEEAAADKSISLSQKVARNQEKNDEMVRRGKIELLKAAKAYNDSLIVSAERTAQADRFLQNLIIDEIRETETLQQNAMMARTAAPQIEVQATATRHLSAARKELLGITQDLHHVEDMFHQASKGEVDALIDATQRVGDLGGEFAGLIGGTKAAAEVRGGMDVALSIENGAKFVESWGTDVAALEASAQYAMAAGEMFKVAGRGNRSVSRPGGSFGGSSYGSRDTGGGRYSDSGGGMPPQTLAPGAASPGGRFGGGPLTVLVVGDHEAGQWLAGTLNRAVDRGVTLTSTSSQRGAPVGH